MKKTFSTLAVMGVYTRRVLEDHGFPAILEVMDHFYPGISNIGAAAMQSNAAKEIKRQIPNAIPWEKGDDWRDYAKRAVELLGPQVKLDGPV